MQQLAQREQRIGLVEQLRGGSGDALEHVAHGGCDQVLLGGEVAERGALPNARTSGYLRDGRVESALAENLDGGIDQRTPVALCIRTLTPRCGRVVDGHASTGCASRSSVAT